ncbi:MAG: alpha/beta hydrolase [Rhodoblastus sp.]|nr:MAG: alpha/beta hydrolase [Rhodoblastus sp.]
MIARKWIAVMSGALMLAGCGGRTTGVMAPSAAVAPPPGASTVEMIVATTRSPASAAEMFSGERGDDLAFADVAVSVPPDSARKIGDVQWPSRLPGDPAKEFVTLRAKRLEPEQAKKLFHEKIARTKRAQALVFVHGYNTRFEEAVYRFAQIVHDSGAPVTPVLFTWPSRGRLLAYNYDREAANYSRDALEMMLQRMAHNPEVGEISILAHSMGNWVTLEALRQMAIRDKHIASKIKSVMLAAPDVDFDVFRRQIAQMGEPRPRFTLFVSQDDDALAASARIGGGQARLGMVDPKIEPYRSALEKAKLDVVDLTDIKSSDSINHGKFAQAPQVVQSIGRRLADGQTLHDGKAGVGEKIGQVAVGAASAAGRAAGVVVSAPLAVVDERTREGSATQIEQIGSDIGGSAGAAAGVATLR